jgi:hypothetical protein
MGGIYAELGHRCCSGTGVDDEKEQRKKGCN